MNSPDLRIVLGSTTSVRVELLDDAGEPEVFSGTLSSANLALREVTAGSALWTSSGGTPTLVGNILELPISTGSLPAGRYVGQFSITLSSGSFKTPFFDVEVS